MAKCSEDILERLIEQGLEDLATPEDIQLALNQLVADGLVEVGRRENGELVYRAIDQASLRKN